MDPETFEEMLWIGAGIDVERLIYINAPGQQYLMTLGIQFSYCGDSTTMILDFSDTKCPLEDALEIIANTLYLKVRDMRDDDDED